MNTELTLKDFKRIEEHIQLRNFNQVNYFVGKNASGKSSILNALSYLNDGSNSRHFFTRHSTVDFKLGSKNQFIVWEDEKINPNNVSHKGNLILKIFTPENGGIEKGANGVYKPKFIFDNIGKAQLDFINQVSEKLNLNSLKAERIINNNDPWSSEVGTRVFKDKDKTVNLLFLSQGLKTFMDLSYVITQAFGSLKEDEKHSVDAIFFIFEEPENNLHPELQKKVPDFFHEVISGLDQILKEKIYFFVSTHSPFVISAAAKYPNQKVYLIDNGSLLDIQRNTVNFSDGYSGAECAWVVGQMLGSDITDLGYPENYCILEEYSLQLLLEDSRNKNIIKNVQFVSASGVMRAISLNDTINELLNLNTIIKCNAYYFDKYYLVVDNLNSLGESERKKIFKVKETLKDRFIELKKQSLEEYYLNIDSSIYQNSLSEINKARGKEKGIVKASYANLISEKITSRDLFSKLFDNELDFLLK